MVVLVIVGSVLTFMAGFLAVAMTGAGHGAYGPTLIVYGPVWYCIFLWPMIIRLASMFATPWAKTPIPVPSLRDSWSEERERSGAANLLNYFWFLNP